MYIAFPAILHGASPCTYASIQLWLDHVRVKKEIYRYHTSSKMISLLVVRSVSSHLFISYVCG